MVSPPAGVCGGHFFSVIAGIRSKRYFRGVKKHPLTLILGGAASGKSEFAEKLADRLGRRILYLATALENTAVAHTEEWKKKIGLHQKRRPSHWHTKLLNGRPTAGILAGLRPDGILLDSLTLWISARFQKNTAEFLEQSFLHVLDSLRTRAPIIIVSDEIGLGPVPLSKSMRKFLDILGRTNARIAREAKTVFFVVSGQPIRIKPAP